MIMIFHKHVLVIFLLVLVFLRIQKMLLVLLLFLMMMFVWWWWGVNVVKQGLLIGGKFIVWRSVLVMRLVFHVVVTILIMCWGFVFEVHSRKLICDLKRRTKFSWSVIRTRGEFSFCAASSVVTSSKFTMIDKSCAKLLKQNWSRLKAWNVSGI